MSLNNYINGYQSLCDYLDELMDSPKSEIKMELVKTYDIAGNLSEETYIETSEGELIETSKKIGKEIDQRPELRRVYFEEMEPQEAAKYLRVVVKDCLDWVKKETASSSPDLNRAIKFYAAKVVEVTSGDLSDEKLLAACNYAMSCYSAYTISEAIDDICLMQDREALYPPENDEEHLAASEPTAEKIYDLVLWVKSSIEGLKKSILEKI